MDTIIKDIRYSVRVLVKSRGFTLAALIALALGIGATTAIFSVVNAILIRPLPFKDADRIVVPVSFNAVRNIERGGVSYADYLDYINEPQVFEYAAAYQSSSRDLTDSGEPERIEAAIVAGEYFQVMKVEPLRGRFFTPDDITAGSPTVAVISYRLWQRRFGGDEATVGQAITVSGIPLTVIGVMPADSQWPTTTDLWVPPPWGANLPADVLRRDNFVWRAVARLRSGVTIEQATATLQTIASRAEQQNPDTLKNWSAMAIPIHEYIVGPTLSRLLFVLLGAVGFVLLIACVNVANLMLARAATREREIAIRTALGAGRARLVRQLLTESLLLSIVGGALGLLLALWGVDVLISLAPDGIPRLGEASIDLRVLAFVATISLLTSLAFGLIPALHTSKVDLNETLKEGGRGSTGGRRSRRLRSLLVVSEVALSLLLLIGAGLMIRSFLRLQQVDPGVKTDNLITMNISAPRSTYKQSAEISSFYDRLLEKVKVAPGVRSACTTSALPLGGGGFYLGRVFLIEGHPEPPAGPDHEGQWNVISPGYFNTMGIRLMKGRDFKETDTADNSLVIIINETMANRMFPNEDPIGKRIRSWRDENKLREIVGVAQNVRYFGKDDEQRGLVYVPHRQDSWRSMAIVAHTEGNPNSTLGAIRDAIWSIDSNVAIANTQTMEQVLRDSVASQRFSMLLLSIFAGVALILAAVGIYGILSYSVAQRRHEIGIRMALGAQGSDVFKIIVGQGFKLTLIGVVIGVAVALALTQVMTSLLFEVSATDPLTFAIVSLTLVGVALGACFVPARRATKVDPMVALRYE